MKKILLLLLILPIIGFGQSSSFERGFKDGYCQAKKEDKGQYTTCATTPLAPMPKAGKESYQDGFVEGYKKYSNSSSKNILIDGAKDVGNSKRPSTNSYNFSNNESKPNNAVVKESNNPYEGKYRYNGRLDSRSIKYTFNQIRKQIKKQYKYSNLPKKEKKKQLELELNETYKQELKAFEDLAKKNSAERRN